MNRMMMRTLASVAVALAGLACASGGVPRDAEPLPFEIRGVVVDADSRAPLSGALVRSEALNAGASTDAAGAFRVRGHARPGRYALAVARLGYAPALRRIRIRREGRIELGTLALRAGTIQVDDLVVPKCMRHDRPPADTAPGAIVRAERDSAGAFWTVCRPPDP
jgi:hypothetical protein